MARQSNWLEQKFNADFVPPASKRLPVAIDAGGDLTRGQTTADRRGRTANAAVCRDVDAARLTAMTTKRPVSHPWPATP